MIQGDAELGAPIRHGKLGCLAPPKLARAKLSNVLKTGYVLPAPPSARDWSRVIMSGGQLGEPFKYDAFGNNQVGDCTCATYGSADATVARQMGVQPVVTTDAALDAYDAISGWSRAKPTEHDNGASADDAANYFAWWDPAVAKDSRTANGGLISAHAELDPHDRRHLELAVDLCLGCVVTFDLPQSIWSKHQKVWDVAPAGVYEPDYIRGSLGGHSVWVAGYDARGPLCITWGQRQAMTWEFYETYVSGAIAAVHRALAHAVKLTPSGYLASEILAAARKL